MDPAALIQITFATMAAGLLFVNAMPSFGDRFILYGARMRSSSLYMPGSEPRDATKMVDKASALDYALDCCAKFRVPHSWFLHFYIVSVTSSLFWATQILVRGRLFCVLSMQQADTRTSAMQPSQLVLVWALMTVQGTRRLVESKMFMKPSASKMWIGHWAVGIFFYVTIGVAVWIEGSDILLRNENLIGSISITSLSIKTVTSSSIFLAASVIQYQCHRHLASLEKYSLPTHWAFEFVVCPHYTVECLIYLSLALVAAPAGAFMNSTVFSAFVFTITNLSITARGTRAWYIRKFGQDSMGDARAIVPYVY